ncbi:MAG: sporadic carbohydrate cluster 2OG-Fe(II) oxygenase [Bdellovibrionota bacterium]
MSVFETFIDPNEEALGNKFLTQGYLNHPVDNRSALDALRHAIVEIVAEHIGAPLPKDEAHFLNFVHEQVPVEKLNDMRLKVFSKMNAIPWFKPTYYGLAKSALDAVVGNELAMQSSVNLSVQYPNDRSSLLSVHADTWSEESPFQVVAWLPLVDVYDTKAMYLLSPEKNRTVNKRLRDISKTGGSDKLFEAYEKDFEWVKVPYGNVLVFSPNLLHGNVVNVTPETRWSMNVRFKGLFTPYMSEEKKLGDFYLPITTKVVTRVGINYKVPEGFDE